MTLCPVCRGRGEVEAGISLGAIQYGPVTVGYDWRGNEIPTRAAYPAAYVRNPKASEYLLETNPFGDLWGIAICKACGGTGMSTTCQLDKRCAIV